MRSTSLFLVVFVCILAFASAQRCRTTSGLNARTCPSLSCGIATTLPNGASVTISGRSRNANGLTWVPIGNGRWVAQRYLSCGGGGSNPSPRAPPSGGARPAPNPPSGGGGGSNDLNSYPSTLSTSGYTYRGNSARVLHFLKARFGASATTYASHSDGATASADLWTPGATYGKNNAGVPSMNALADYVAGNLGRLGVKYVIWRQRINSGSGWRGMNDRGSITQNHFDHVHVTFQNPSARAVGDFESDFAEADFAEVENLGDTTDAVTDPKNANSGSSDSIPAWGVGLLIAGAFIIVLAIVGVVGWYMSSKQARVEVQP